MRIHDVFHVSQIKLFLSRPFCPPSRPPPPSQIIDGSPTYTVSCIWTLGTVGGVISIWWTERAADPKSPRGGLTCCRIFIVATLLSLMGRQEAHVEGEGYCHGARVSPAGSHWATVLFFLFLPTSLSPSLSFSLLCLPGWNSLHGPMLWRR